MADRNSESSLGGVPAVFTALDFVDTVPFVPDEGSEPVSTMSAGRVGQSSLFFDDPSDERSTRAHLIPAHAGEVAIGARARLSTGESAPPPIASPGGVVLPGLSNTGPSGNSDNFTGRSNPVAIARIDTGVHATSRTSSRPRAPEEPVNRVRSPQLQPQRRAAVPAKRMPATLPRRTMLLAAAIGASSVVALMQITTRPARAMPGSATAATATAPEAPISSAERQSHTEPAATAEPIVDERSAARSMHDAVASTTMQPQALTREADAMRPSDTSLGRGRDQPGPSAAPTSQVRRRVAVPREAIAASVAAAQSKADAFLRSESATRLDPARDSGGR